MIWYKTEGTVYFLRCDNGGPVKVGFTSGNVYGRVRALQSTTFHVLTWVGAFQGTPADERAIKKELAPYLIRNEWFHPVKPVLDLIAEKSPDFDRDVFVFEMFHGPIWAKCREIDKKFQYKRGFCFNMAVGRVADLSPYTFAKWMSRESQISREDAEKYLAAAIELEAGAAQ